MAKHPAIAYCHGVLDGTVPANGYVRMAVERHMRDLETGAERGLHFDRNDAQHAIDFFGFLRHSTGEWVGQPFDLAPWQQFILWNLFGWRREDGFRRFRTAYISVARKNGKTALAAGIALYLMVADRESGAHVFSAATKREQAKLCWSEAVKMVQKSPSLSKMVKHYKASFNLSVEATGSKFEPLGADSDTMDGLNVHGAIIDELHAHKDSGIVDVLETATGARRQPLTFEITTAGSDQTSICYQHHDYVLRILKQVVNDDTWFGYYSSIDDDDDWADESTWAKANPNLGVTVKLDDLERKADKAKHLPAAQNAFRRLHLNQWTQQSDRWIDLTLWDHNAGKVDEESLVGRVCYGGLDLSSVSDLTAWVMLFPQVDKDHCDVVARFWVPESQLHNTENKWRDLYQVWYDKGLLRVTPGDAVDYAFVKRDVLADAQRFRLMDLNVDRLFQGYQLSQELADEGLTVFGFGMGFVSMAPVTREFERRLLLKGVHHGGNPVLRWMADNVAVKQDPAGNLKPDKANSGGKIDGIVALLMALDRLERNETGPSVYETQGLLVLG